MADLDVGMVVGLIKALGNPGGGGSGGGGSTGGVTIVQATFNWDGETVSCTLDKTFEEILDHIKNGGACFVVETETGICYTLSKVFSHTGESIDTLSFGTVSFDNDVSGGITAINANKIIITKDGVTLDSGRKSFT